MEFHRQSLIEATDNIPWAWIWQDKEDESKLVDSAPEETIGAYACGSLWIQLSIDQLFYSLTGLDRLQID